MSSIKYPTPEFALGDQVIADGDYATITDIINAPDSEFEKWVTYGVEWETGEWGTFEGHELIKVIEKNA